MNPLMDNGVLSMYLSGENYNTTKSIEHSLTNSKKIWSQGGLVNICKEQIGFYQENQEFLSRSYNSREEFIEEYKKYKISINEEDFYAQILIEVRQALLNNDFDNFIRFSNIIDYITRIKDQLTLKDYFNNVNNPIKNTNLIILACQYNKAKILEYLLDDSSKILNNLSTDIGKNIILPYDEDETHHNAFYYAIRSTNIELVNTLIDKWPHNYFTVNFCELDAIISQVYEELKLKNVPLSEEMEFFVENKLVSLRFFSNASKQDRNTKCHYNNIKARIDLVLQNINLLKSDYSNAKRVDEKFLLMIKFITQNIHTLKRQLKSTYLKLPWEEMEFCLISFVSSYLKTQEINLFYHYALNKTRILNHLENFSKKLKDEKDFIESVGIGKVSDLSINRNKVITQIIKDFPQFEELYKDYQQIRDMYSLTKISTYLKLALSVDPKQREGQLTITRVLQVIGECFKNSLESPKLSNTTSELLLQLLPKNTRKIIIDLRNSLSHAHSLSKRMEIEENADATFFSGVQNDIKKIDNVISDIIYENKIKIIKIMLKKITKSESLEEIQEIIEIFSNVKLDKMMAQDYKMMEHEKLEKLIKELRDSIVDKTYYEKELFNGINTIINDINTKAANVNFDYMGAFFAMKSLVIGLDDYYVDQNFIREKNSFANKIFKNFGYQIEPYNLKNIAEFSVKIARSVKSRLQNEDIIEKMYRIICEIFYITQFATDDLKWIEELRDQLNEKGSFIPMHKQRKISSISQEKYNHQLTLKLTELETILKNKSLDDNHIIKFSSYKRDKNLQAVIEMLVLDILAILGRSEEYLENNLLFFDDRVPLLNGKCLRNHLAHENVLVDVFLSDPSITVFLNAEKLISENIIKTKKKLGKLIKDEPSKLKDKYDQSLVTIVNQQNMFKSLEEGNLEDLKSYLRKGADIYARSINSQSALQFAAKGHSLEILKFTLDQNLDANAKDINGQNALHIAAANGRVNILEFLIKKAVVNVDDLDKMHRTALHIAAKNGHKEIVEILLKNKANYNIKDMFTITPLHYAIQNNQIDVTEILLEKEVNVDASKSVGGDTSLHWAADGGFLEIVKLLLQNGSNVNIRNDRGEMPLHIAALNGRNEVLDFLILKGADVNCGALDGFTPLHYAIESGYEKTVSILLKHGANVNAVDMLTKKTPLHLAAAGGYEKIVKLLLKNKAITNVANVENITPLHIAARDGHLEIVTDLIKQGVNINAKDKYKGASLYYAAENGQKEIVELLIKNEAKINEKSVNDLTPLHIAALKGHKDVVDLLIRNKADVNSQDIKGSTPLIAASMNGDKDIIELLIKNKARVNTRNKSGMTALHVAAREGRQEAVAFLIKNKAEINVKADHGFTPLHAAVLGKHKDIVSILIENKAEVDGKSTISSTPLHLAVDAGFQDIVEILIANKSNVNIEYSNATPLITAIKHNHINIVEILVKNGANVITRYGNALHIAVIGGYKDIVEILLNNTALINTTNSENWTPLHCAAARGHKEMVNSLISRRANVNAVTFFNSTPLYFAAEGGHEEVVKILLANGAKVNILNDEGAPLHIAAGCGYYNIVEVLLKNEADFDLKDNLNRTALELAVSHGHLNVVKMLLQYKNVDMNAKGNDDYTILHIASQESNLEMVKFLVEKGSNIHAVNTSGSKPIHISAREGHKDTVEFFLSKGLSINEPGLENQTLLHYAVMKGGIEVVKYLITQGADPNAKDNNGVVPMHIAAMFGYTEIIKVLLINGAIYNDIDNLNRRRPLEITKKKDVKELLISTENLFESVKCNDSIGVENNIKSGAIVNAKNRGDVMPLHYAAWKGYDEIVKILLRNKANPNALGKKGCTPIHYAAKFSHLKIVKLLLSHGAIYNALSYGNQTPLDFAENRNIKTLFELINESFKNVKANNAKVINELNKIRDIDTVKAVMCARNRENKTLIVFALHNNFSSVDKLKRISQNDISAQIETASLLFQNGKYQEALNIYRSAFDRRKEILGPDNPGTLDIQIQIAMAIFKQGEYEKSLNILKEILETQKEVLGVNNVDTLSTRSLVALVLHNLGRDEESLSIYQEVCKKQKEILGSNHLHTLDTQFNMALVLDKLGKYDEALKINRAMFKTMEKLRGKDDPYTLSAKNNIAFVLSNQGKYEESLKIYNEVLKMKKKILGENHLDTLRTSCNIARILFNQNKWDEALEAYQDVLNKQKKYLQQNHPETLITQYNIANILYAQNKFVNALIMFKESFDKMKSVYGSNHPTVLDILKKIEKIELSINVELKLKSSRSSMVDLLSQLQNDISVQTPETLWNAAGKGDIQTLQHLLKLGANVNDKDVNGITPLHYAVSNGHLNIVEILLKHGADVTQITNKGNTPLHIATSKGYQDIIDTLLEHIDHIKLLNCECRYFVDAKTANFVNARTASTGTTSLHIAAKNGFLNIVKFLLNHGGIYNIQNKEGKTPINLSKDQNVINFLKLVEELFENAEKGNVEIINKLNVAKRYDFLSLICSRNIQGETLLDVASKHKNIHDKLTKMLQEF